jgi:hypothetical protein
MQLLPLPLEVRFDLSSGNINNLRILDCRWHLHLLFKLSIYRILNQLSQNSPQRLAASSFWNHTLSLNHAAETCNATDLPAYGSLYLDEQFVFYNFGAGLLCGRDECKR